MKKNDMTPLRSCRLRSIAGSISAASPRLTRRFSHHTNSISTSAPAKIIQITGDSPSHSGASGFGFTKPHVPDLRTPSTIAPSPSADRAVPTRSSRAPSSAGVSFMRRARPRITSTMTTSPANTHRQDA